MCLLAIYKSGRPNRETLEKQERANPHGAGLAWFGEDGIPQFRRGLTGDELDTLLDEIPAPFVYHFRLASVGGVTPTLTHPFSIGRLGTRRLAGVAPGGLLFHNGHVAEWKQLLIAAGVRTPGGTCSDTKAVAAILYGRSRQNQMRLLNSLAGKFALLLPGGVIERTGEWFSADGGMHSNLYWMPNRYTFNEEFWPRRIHTVPPLLNQPDDIAETQLFNSEIY